MLKKILILIILLINFKKIYNFSLSYNSPKLINNLARENYKLVYYFSKNFINKHKLNKDLSNELIQEGFVGLMYAARKYDINNTANAKFTTYSSYWIKSYMTKYIKNIYKNNYIPLNEEILKYYDEESKIINNINLDILNFIERDIIFKRYIRKPRIIKKKLACEYNISAYEVTKINDIALKKLKKQYIIENNITYL